MSVKVFFWDGASHVKLPLVPDKFLKLSKAKFFQIFADFFSDKKHRGAEPLPVIAVILTKVDKQLMRELQEPLKVPVFQT